ncbi:MAG: SIS domain-containing protein [Candidatus Nanopelagicales bacterium]
MSIPVNEALLDSVEALAAADSGESLIALASAGAQVRESELLAREAGIEGVADDGRPRAVVVAALGGSSLVADLLGALAGPGSPVPVIATHAKTLPGWVSPVDLVVAVSLSGAAEGPLAVAAEAARRGCRLVTVGSANSPLATASARVHGVHVPVSRSRRTSRASLWSLAVPVLAAAHALDLVDVSAAVLSETADVLDEIAERMRPASESFVNPAKSLALELAGSVPLVLGTGDLAGVAAVRAATQLARNARHPAVTGVLPDAATEVVATFDGPFARQPADIFADPFEDGGTARGARIRLLMLRDTAADEQTLRVAQAVWDGAIDAGVRVSEAATEGTSDLARVASLVAFTDFASTYLALASGLDPNTSPHIADLRERTAR